MSSPHGVIAYFYSPEEILVAAKAAKKKGFVNYESYTPFSSAWHGRSS